MSEVSSVLGFDFGLRRIGVATGQTITATAAPLTTIDTADNGTHFDDIIRLIERWKPDLLLVGVPYMLDGSETEMSKQAKQFSDQLGDRSGLPVQLVDETLSSAEAEEILKQRMQLGQHNKSEIDRMAAAIIVQSWLDQHT